MSARVEVRNLSHSYGDTTALRDVSFTLEPGRIHGLLGRNGSGKTTLLSILAGFRKATSGQALLDGVPIFENEEAMRHICLIREGGDTVEGRERVRAALEFAAAMRPNWDANYAAHLLERFAVPPGKKVGQLSRGQRAALACTLGLASRAPLTMFDESYLGMDAPSRYIFYDELLRDFMEHPRTIIVSTHLIEEVSSLFEEVLILGNGRLLLHDEAEEFRARGITITGPREAVDRVVDGMTVLSSKELGSTKSVVLYGNLDSDRRQQAIDAGLELGPLPLQDLFVHLTSTMDEPR